MGFKAFPHRLIVRIGDEAYRKLRQESRKAGYQVALVERWFLIPQDSATSTAASPRRRSCMT